MGRTFHTDLTESDLNRIIDDNCYRHRSAFDRKNYGDKNTFVAEQKGNKYRIIYNYKGRKSDESSYRLIIKYSVNTDGKLDITCSVRKNIFTVLIASVCLLLIIPVATVSIRDIINGGSGLIAVIVCGIVASAAFFIIFGGGKKEKKMFEDLALKFR